MTTSIGFADTNMLWLVRQQDNEFNTLPFAGFREKKGVFLLQKKQWNEFLSKMNRLQQKDGIKYGNLSHDAGDDTAAKYCTPEEKMVKYF